MNASTIANTVPLVLLHHFPGGTLTVDSVATCGAPVIPGSGPTEAVATVCPACWSIDLVLS